MAIHEYVCEAGHLTHLEIISDGPVKCSDISCQFMAFWQPAMPQVSFNHWVPDPREMNAHKERVAAGMYE